MSDFVKLIDEIDEGIANGCDYELLEKSKNELKRLRNELCFRCGAYERKHLGACEGCRYDV